MNERAFNHDPQDLRLVEDGLVLDGADVESIDRMLDRLARAERADAPAGLAERVFERTRDQLGPRVAARLRPPHGSDQSQRPGLLTPLRAAAVVALAATVGVALLATESGRSTAPQPRQSSLPLESYIDAWASNSRDLTGDLSARVSALDAEMAALHDDLAGGSTVYDPWSDEGAL